MFLSAVTGSSKIALAEVADGAFFRDYWNKQLP
jgi:hypothetical protein